MNTRNAISVLSLATLCSMTALCDMSVATAQQRNPANDSSLRTRPANRASQDIQWQGNNQLLATCVAIDNKAEIALATFAQSKAQDEKVKQFAQMVVQEHEQFQQKLQRFAPSAGQVQLESEQAATRGESKIQQAGGTSPSNTGVRQTAGTQADREPQNNKDVSRNAAGQQSGEAAIDPVQLHRELAAQCLADTKKMLSEKDQDKFDECFIGQQLALHGATISKLKVLKRHASEELAQVLDEGLEVTQQHFDKAEQLMKDLADTDASGK